MTPLDTLLIDQYTGGTNMPLAAQAGFVARANTLGNNVQYVGPQELAGSGAWNGLSEELIVRGSGARAVTIQSGYFLGQKVTVIDADGNSGAGTITVSTTTVGGTIAGTATISSNHDSRTFVYVGADKWVRMAG